MAALAPVATRRYLVAERIENLFIAANIAAGVIPGSAYATLAAHAPNESPFVLLTRAFLGFLEGGIVSLSFVMLTKLFVDLVESCMTQNHLRRNPNFQTAPAARMTISAIATTGVAYYLISSALKFSNGLSFLFRDIASISFLCSLTFGASTAISECAVTCFRNLSTQQLPRRESILPR